MKTTAKVFIIIGMVGGAVAILPLVVGLIALEKLKTATCKADIIVISILTLFFNPIAGIIMLFLKDKHFINKEMDCKKKKTIKDRMKNFYNRNIKKWRGCPACPTGKMSINKKSAMWTCEDCGYQISEKELEDGYMFLFCNECGSYLNTQDGFDYNANKNICKNCGHENNMSFENIKGKCIDCGKLLPDPNATLCVDCRLSRREKTTNKLIVAGVVTAAVVGAACLAGESDDDSSDEDDDYTGFLDDDNNYTALPESGFEEWVEDASREELSNAYEKERQQWIKDGYCEGTGEYTPKMKRLNSELNKRDEEEWKKDPKRNTDPHFRWTDANRWDKD